MAGMSSTKCLTSHGFPGGSTIQLVRGFLGTRSTSSRSIRLWRKTIELVFYGIPIATCFNYCWTANEESLLRTLLFVVRPVPFIPIISFNSDAKEHLLQHHYLYGSSFFFQEPFESIHSFSTLGPTSIKGVPHVPRWHGPWRSWNQECHLFSLQILAEFLWDNGDAATILTKTFLLDGSRSLMPCCGWTTKPKKCQELVARSSNNECL